jgi:hypothetical protein
VEGGDTIKEEGIETVKSLVILAIFLGSAFTVAAMIPEDEVCCEESGPLEVEKTKISGPTVLVIDSPAKWELEITVVNNLEPTEKEISPEKETEEPVVSTTRSEGAEYKVIKDFDPNTIIDVIVKDEIPADFVLLEFKPSLGDVKVEKNRGGTQLTWKVGPLKPQGKATLYLVVGTVRGGFQKAGSYVLNGGATANGLLYGTKEAVSDGPTRSILLTVTDGVPLEAPVAEAGIAQMTFEDNPAYLDGSGSYDPDGAIVKYEWYLGDKCIGRTETVLTYLPLGKHVVTLIVEDNHKLTASDEVIVTVYEKDAVVDGGSMTGAVRDAATRRGFDPYIVISNGNFELSTWTDMGGNYRLIGIPEGNYRVTCQTDGYQDFSDEVYIPENTEVAYDIYMERE